MDFRQHDGSDCGPACLRFVAAHYGLKLPLARIRQACQTNARGTNAAALAAAAGSLGFLARGAKGEMAALAQVPLPLIAHLVLPNHQPHYVVVTKWKKTTAYVMDPAVGRIERWSHERFSAAWTGKLILLAPGERFQPGDQTVSPWRRLWGVIAPHRRILLQTFLGAVATTVLGLAMSVYVQKIVDHVIPNGNRPLLNLLAVAMLVVLGARLALGWFQSLLSLRVAQHIDAALILAYYRHLLQLPQPFFDTMRVGEITSRVLDAVKIRNFLHSALTEMLLNPLVLVVSLAAMFFWSWKLALISLALLPPNIALYVIVNRLNRTDQRRVMERAADFDAQLVESLGAQRVIRQFQLETDASLRTETRLVRLLKVGWQASLRGLACNTAGTTITQVYLIGLLWLGAGLVLDAALTPGELISCFTLAGYLTGPLTAMLGFNPALQEALVAIDRLFDVLDQQRERDPGTIEFTPRHAGDIRFEDVTFRHAGRHPVLMNFSLTIPSGKITLLAGESGCGKSTVLALIQRLYTPEQGRIVVDGHDLQYFRLGSLRRHVAVVPQHIQLIAGTVWENIAPGTFQPDLEKIIRICREAGALEFIEKLPQGFLTHLNENGGNLSGGQRQRLAIARALYTDAPILLFDEPSSALDARTERHLLELLLRLRADGRTIVVAAHTERLLEVADQVIEIREGRASLRPEAQTTPSLETRVA